MKTRPMNNKRLQALLYKRAFPCGLVEYLRQKERTLTTTGDISERTVGDVYEQIHRFEKQLSAKKEA